VLGTKATTIALVDLWFLYLLLSKCHNLWEIYVPGHSQATGRICWASTGLDVAWTEWGCWAATATGPSGQRTDDTDTHEPASLPRPVLPAAGSSSLGQADWPARGQASAPNSPSYSQPPGGAPPHGLQVGLLTGQGCSRTGTCLGRAWRPAGARANVEGPGLGPGI
jgi:hypothetical protein